jgi:hypothetical protein
MKKSVSFRLLSGLFFLSSFLLVTTESQGQEPFDRAGHDKIVQYLLDNKIIDQIDRVTLWTTPYALDTTYVIRHMIREKSEDIAFPFKSSWLVMIDDNPDANFGHPVRWIFINAEFTMHSDIMQQDFPPIVMSDLGKGKPVLFKCWDLTPYKCDLMQDYKLDIKYIRIAPRNCRYAVLVSGGINSGMNKARYAQNLKSMYMMLRNAGYPKNHIYVYYADGTLDLDCDNADGDNNDATGSDVTAGAIENTIRLRYQTLCSPKNSRCHVLFSFFSNHGADNTGVCLWDLDGDGLENDELYSPAELSADVANSRFCRHFMIHDQCYSGDFLPIATDGNHTNLVVYASASATEVSWGREYMARWEQNNITTTTVNDMHLDVVNNGNLTSTPGMAEGTAGIGDYLAGKCCCCWWWWRYWYVIIIIIGLGGLIIRKLYKKR